MKASHSNHRFAGTLLAVAALVTGFVLPARAQLNESKIERDAAGVYSGKESGGAYVVTYDDPLIHPTSGSTPEGEGKVRVPVKDGKLSTTLSDPDLPGNDKAACSGAEQKSKVTRGGKSILVKAKGMMSLDDGTFYGPWMGATISGQLDNKGTKWQADTTSSAYQRNGSPPDQTKRVTGLDLKGKS